MRTSVVWQLVGGVMATLSATAMTSARVPPEPTSTRPVAVLGGVIAIPLKAPPENTGFPSEIPIEIRDGALRTSVTGRVVWLVDPGPALDRRWTRSANPLVARTLPEGGDPRTLLRPGAVRIEGALLLADLPPTSAAATLTVGETVLEPHWIEAGSDPTVDPELGVTWRDDRPDPISPFEWFRWALIAESRNEPAPAPPGDAATQLVARHVGELWRAGIGRVARQSRGVSLTIRSWLTATCRIEDRAGAPEIGAWVADPAELSSLLSLLLDPTRDDDATMRAALAWTDARSPLTMWVESDVGGVLTFAVANAQESEIVVRVQWLGETLPPLATLVPARTVGRMRVERPDRPTSRGALAGESPEALVLAIAAGNFSKRIAVAPAAVTARPPAISFGTFVAPISLAEAQSGIAVPIAPAWATTASLRRRGERWELFAECRADVAAQVSDGVRVRFGRREVFVNREGTVDGDTDASLDVGVKAFDGVWRMRIGVPAEWLPRPNEDGAIARLALRREAGPLRSTAVLAVPAHLSGDAAMPVVEVDLARWTAGER